jgi:signal transduction histidine kinase
MRISLVAGLAGEGSRLEAGEASLSAGASPPLVTSAREVLGLGLEAARQSAVPVRLQGLVTYPDPGARLVYVQDGSAGIRVLYTNADQQLAPGQMAVVDGTVAGGEFAPFIDCANVRVLGQATLPEPIEVSAARLAAGELFGQWVQVEGVVRDVAKDPDGALVFVSSGGLRFHGVIQPFPGSALPLDWLDSRVALRGACRTEVDAENRPMGFTLYVPGTNHVAILRPGQRDVFGQPALPMNARAELCRQSDARIKVVGTVAFHSPSGYVYLQSEEGAVRARLLIPLARGRPQTRYVERKPVVPLRPGEIIELVGAPSATTFSPLLQDAEFRRVGEGPPPVPMQATASELFAGKMEDRLVSLRARLLASELRPAGALKHQVFSFQAGDTIFDAVWEFAGTDTFPALPKNSYVRISGVCTLELGELNQIRSFRLLLRQPSDLQLLGRPAWWEGLPVGRIFAGTIALGAVALVWIWQLRRRVSQRTAELQAEVSERQRAQRELHQALTAERELNELRSRFVSMVSHEFRTPLGVILSAAENLDSYFERLAPEQRRKQLEHVIQSTRQMAKVMENVLFIGRAEAGKVEFKPASLDLPAFCESLAGQIQSPAASKTPIRFHAEPVPPARGDETLLRQILTNLLTNAVKYSNGGAPIEFSLGRRGGEAIFRVKDGGIGIPAADQGQLFNPFQRGGNVGQIPGTGLGLVIVKRCVELHGGRITCESVEGRGTTFIVRLPIFPSG